MRTRRRPHPIASLKTTLWLCGSLSVVLLSSSARTALPPKYAKMRRKRIYANARRLQKKAPEVLKIKILEVKTKKHYVPHRGHKKAAKRISGYTYRVDAVILKVVRTKTKLRRKQRIRFSYQTRRRVCPGPRIYNPKTVKKGQRVTAYLRYNRKLSKQVGRYELAASVLSLQ